MKLTNFDTDLILALMELNGATTTQLAHQLLDPKDDYELRKDDSKIRYRLQRMEKGELLKRESVKYIINVERVFLTKAAMHLDIGVDISMGYMLVVYPKDEDLIMRQISFEQVHKNRP